MFVSFCRVFWFSSSTVQWIQRYGCFFVFPQITKWYVFAWSQKVVKAYTLADRLRPCGSQEMIIMLIWPADYFNVTQSQKRYLLFSMGFHIMWRKRMERSSSAYSNHTKILKRDGFPVLPKFFFIAGENMIIFSKVKFHTNDNENKPEILMINLLLQLSNPSILTCKHICLVSGIICACN